MHVRYPYLLARKRVVHRRLSILGCSTASTIAGAKWLFGHRGDDRRWLHETTHPAARHAPSLLGARDCASTWFRRETVSHHPDSQPRTARRKRRSTQVGRLRSSSTSRLPRPARRQWGVATFKTLPVCSLQQDRPVCLRFTSPHTTNGAGISILERAPQPKTQWRFHHEVRKKNQFGTAAQRIHTLENHAENHFQKRAPRETPKTSPQCRSTATATSSPTLRTVRDDSHPAVNRRCCHPRSVHEPPQKPSPGDDGRGPRRDRRHHGRRLRVGTRYWTGSIPPRPAHRRRRRSRPSSPTQHRKTQTTSEHLEIEPKTRPPAAHESLQSVDDAVLSSAIVSNELH